MPSWFVSAAVWLVFFVGISYVVGYGIWKIFVAFGETELLEDDE